MTAILEHAAALQLDPAAQDLLFREARTANKFTDAAVVNIGRPAEGAWFGRLPRLEFHEVVSTV